MKNRLPIRTLVSMAILASSFGVAATLRATQATQSTEEGRELFMIHCEGCHGATGKGDGPAASLLRQRPSDLTLFTARNGGVFPGARLRRIIDGRDIVAHGRPEMPAWGNAFTRSSEPAGEDAVRARIEALVEFLETIQTPRKQ
jgi:mono/diheme cytochrome c family protein